MIKYLLVKELLQIKRNAFLPRLVFIFPIVIMCVMPWVMDMEVRNIGVVVVDNDHSEISTGLIERVRQSGYFIFTGTRNTNSEAVNDVETGRADVILTIPQNYGRDLETGRKPQLLVSANAVNGTKGSMGASYMSGIVGIDAAENMKTQAVAMPTGEHDIISELYLYNKHLDYKVFMIPALMSILMMMLCGFLPALNIVGEKESGTIEQINVTPVSRTAFIMAKLIPYWTIGMIVLSICFLLSWLVYGIVPVGSMPLLYLVSMLLAFVFSGFGLVVSNHSDTMQQAIFVMWFFVVCMMLLSGLFTPVRSMPDWAQTLTLANPIRYYIDAMRTIFVRGGGFTDVSMQICVLAVMGLAINVWAIVGYRKQG